MDTLKECIKFASEYPVCSIATVERDQPRVRVVAMFLADETGFYFHTLAAKSFCRQMQKNNKVEVCFARSGQDLMELGPDTPLLLRVSGEVEFLSDPAIKSKILKDRPLQREHYGIDSPEDPRFVLFRIGKGEAFFWRGSDGTKEANIPRIKF